MAERIGIVAIAKKKYEESRPDVDIGELAFEPIEQVLDETGLRFVEDGTGIDAAVTCSQDHDDGKTISGMLVCDVAGGHLRQDEKVANDGTAAVCYGMMQILSGHFDTILVIANTKESHSDRRLIENTAFEPIYSQMLGLDFIVASAMQANGYMQKYGITPEQCAQVVVKNRKNAKGNPTALYSGDITESEVLNSPLMADPLRELDVKPLADGAVALILATEEKAKKITDNPVWIKGFGMAFDSHYIGYRDLVSCDSLVEASRQAYKMAGITDPRKEISLAEISEHYSYQELLWSEGLGFCDRGQGGKLIESNSTQLNGELPINPSGGLISGVPINVAGLDRVAEATLQLSGKAEGRQVDGAKVALAHGTAGICGQFHCVVILER